MYEVEFYRNKNDVSEIAEMLDKLYKRGMTSKTDRINHDKIVAYMNLLKKHGPYIGEPVLTAPYG